MKKNVLLKDKTKKVLKIAAVSVLSAIIVVPAAVKVVGDKVYADYSSDKQVETIAENLGFDPNDTMLIDGKHVKFVHNNGKPIQVVIDQDLKEYEPQITTALDNMVGLIHSVNDKYSYQIVDEASSNLSAITFEAGTPEDSTTISYIDEVYSPYLAATQKNKALIDKGTIYINLENYSQEDSYTQEYIIQHELAHIFGILSDQYNVGNNVTTDSHRGDTFIKPDTGSKINMLTPYDVSSVLALYTPQAKNKEDLKEKISFCQDFLVEYEAKYYDYYTERNKELITNSDDSITFDKINADDEFTFTAEYSLFGHNFYTCNYEITYSNNEYTFKIFDVNGKLLDECSGDAVVQNDILTLKSVTLKNGLKPNSYFALGVDGYIQDLVLYKSNGEMFMYDYCENSVLKGSVHSLEHELGL